MTPTFRIVADGADITSLINDRLLLLRTTDKPGMESDDFELSVDDRDRAVSFSSATKPHFGRFIYSTFSSGALAHTVAVLDPGEFASRYHPL